MRKTEVVEHLARVGQAHREWAKARAKFVSDVSVIEARLLNEAVAAKMSVEQIADAVGVTTNRVRSMMRTHGIDPRRGRNILAKQAAETLATNATIMGIEPSEVDLMSPLAYLPMGDALKREFLETPAGFECGTCGTRDIDAHLFYCNDPSRGLPNSTEEHDDP